LYIKVSNSIQFFGKKYDVAELELELREFEDAVVAAEEKYAPVKEGI
jgi:hypothetical protein